MQQPTCTNVRLRFTTDAHKIFEGVRQGLLHMVTRRLDADERIALRSGCVYAWEERGPHSELTGLGIERFTEGRRWSPSRVRDDFLFYYEKWTPPPDSNHRGNAAESHPPRDWDQLVKQTYSAWVETERGRRKWHLTAYFSQQTVDQLRTVDDDPLIKDLVVPEGIFTSARTNKNRSRTDDHHTDAAISATNASRSFAPFSSPHYQAQNGSPSLAPVLMHEPYQQTSRPEPTASPVYEHSPSPVSPRNITPYIHSQESYPGHSAAASPYASQDYSMSQSATTSRVVSPALSPSQGSRPYTVAAPTTHVPEDLSSRPTSWDNSYAFPQRPRYQHREEHDRTPAPYAASPAASATVTYSMTHQQTYYPNAPHLPHPNGGNTMYSQSYSLQSALTLPPPGPSEPRQYPLSPLQIPDRLPSQPGPFPFLQNSHTYSTPSIEQSLGETDASHEAILAPLDVLRRPVKFPRDPTDEKTLRLLREKASP